MPFMMLTDMTNSPQPNSKILIVGGGFGGARAALKLSRQTGLDITLVSNVPHFSYYPMFYHVATGGSAASAFLPLEEMFAHTTVKVVQDSVAKIDPEARTITSSDGKTTYAYDKLIL